MAMGAHSGILVEGGINLAYAGAFQFGDERGVYFGFRFHDHFFVGMGFTLESALFQARAIKHIGTRMWERWGTK